MKTAAEKIDDQAEAWVVASFSDPYGKSYWQSRFSMENMQEAFRAGFEAAAKQQADVIRQQRGWIEHWQKDAKAGLVPTAESLAAAHASIATSPTGA